MTFHCTSRGILPEHPGSSCRLTRRCPTGIAGERHVAVGRHGAAAVPAVGAKATRRAGREPGGEQMSAARELFRAPAHGGKRRLLVGSCGGRVLRGLPHQAGCPSTSNQVVLPRVVGDLGAHRERRPRRRHAPSREVRASAGNIVPARAPPRAGRATALEAVPFRSYPSSPLSAALMIQRRSSRPSHRVRRLLGLLGAL